MKPAGRHPLYWLFLLAALGLSLFSFYWAFFKAPTEATMGIVQKIFYIHVPCAMALQALFIVSGIASIWYLVKPSRSADQLAVACAEVGVVMSLAALTSGPLWARKAWGHYWEWEPRLTLTLVLAFMFAAYVALRSFGGADDHSGLAGGHALRAVCGVATDHADGQFLGDVLGARQ